MTMATAPVSWLLEGDPWTIYHTLRDISALSEDDPQVQAAHRAVLLHPFTARLLKDVSDWPVTALTNHKAAGHPIHLISLLADFGLSAGDPDLQPVIGQILESRSPEGPFCVKVNVPLHFGGSGTDQLAWALCDAPLVTSALIRFGLADHPAVQSALVYLLSLGRENGWPCAVSPEMGRFRGPGRKEDPCPYATLLMLKCLAFLPDQFDSLPARRGVETLLSQWQNSRERHPYLFYMGDDFRKLKAPLVWFDLLHILDVLSRFSWARQDERLLDMLAVLCAQADETGRFTPGSIWMVWKGWDFGQKKEPSRWLTALAWAILARFDLVKTK
jgi:hypothetical protein